MKRLLICTVCISAMFIGGCGGIIDSSKGGSQGGTRSSAESLSGEAVVTFFNDAYPEGFSEYHYPDKSTVTISSAVWKNGTASLEVNLVANDYSGAAIMAESSVHDLIPYRETGFLEFWIKGSRGGEKASAGLADEEASDKKKTEVLLPIDSYGQIKNEWSLIRIPLADFGNRGAFYDEKKDDMVPHPFDWNKVTEFLITIDKGDNRQFHVWLDDVRIVKSAPAAAPTKAVAGWGERPEIVVFYDSTAAKTLQPAVALFDNGFKEGITPSVYGGKTTFVPRPSQNPDGRQIMAIYLDNSDYSGVNLSMSAAFDVSLMRGGKGGIAFWARFGRNVSRVYLGVSDDESDGKKHQAAISLGDFHPLDTSWHYYMIPLNAFPGFGNWWDEKNNREVPGLMDWTKIDEIGFTADKFGNRVDEGEPASIYLDKIFFVKEIPGYRNPDQYWKGFTSKAADVRLMDFEKPEDGRWETISGDETETVFSLVDENSHPRFGRKALQYEYTLNDWCLVEYNFLKNGMRAALRDWNGHRGIGFWFYAPAGDELVGIAVADAGNEIFSTMFRTTAGWQEVIVPFAAFRKDANSQESDATINTFFDLKQVVSLAFKPTSAGKGSFKLDNIRLTNMLPSPATAKLK